MADEPKTPTYRPKLGFLKDRPSRRIRKKSAALRKIERAQVEAEIEAQFDAALDAVLARRKSPEAPPTNVIPLDQARRKTRR
jgi:hypothetical protein